MSEIIQGLLIGVGVGIILILYAEIQKWISRCGQIAFIRKRLIDGFTRLGKFQDPMPFLEGETPPTADQCRFVILEGFLRELQAIADHRTGSMSGAQLSDLHTALSDAKNMHAWMSQMKRHPQGLNMYGSLYEALAKLKWLGLPMKLPWES